MKKIEINLTDEQLQWLEDNSNGFGFCSDCPLYNNKSGIFDTCDNISQILNWVGCRKVIKYAIENANK